MPEDEPPLAVRIPDDARELAADVAAYRREVARDRRRRRLTRWLGRRWARYGLSGPLVTAVLVVVGLVGSLMAVLAPSTGRRAPAAPLARPGAADGTVGGLLPDALAGLPGSPATLSLRELRPGVLLVVPPGCACRQLATALAAQGAEFGVRLELAGRASDERALGRLADAVADSLLGGRPVVVTDRDGALARAYGEGSAVFVRADGVVVRVERSPQPRGRYEPAVAQLVTR